MAQAAVLPARSASAVLALAMSATCLSAGVLWLAVLAREWPRLAAGGAVCGEASGLLGHCALCYPAAVLTVAGLVLAGLSLPRSRAPAA